MSKLNKYIPSKSGERIDFKFSHFKALQVPKGWDKLFVSIVSVETGKTLKKTSKALVRNGNSQWTDALTESICVSRDNFSNELGDCLLKFVVAMGSTRYGILGEALVNMTSYTSACTPVSLSLKKCNHETILQVRIHCLTPRKNLSNEKSKETNLSSEQFVESHDIAIKSEESDGTLARNIVSLPSKGSVSPLYPKELVSKESSSASSLCCRNDSISTVDSIGSVCFSPKDNMNAEGCGSIGRQDSTSSLGSVPSGKYSTESTSGSNNSYTLPTTDAGNRPVIIGPQSATSALRVADSKNLLGISGDALSEIHAEANMWEKNAGKLMLDLDILRKECSDQAKKLESMDKELLAAYSERDRLKKEVEDLKLALNRSVEKQTHIGDSLIEAEGERCIESEKEINSQEEPNASLELQLNNSRSSNLELVCVFRELEENIKKQKLEMEDSSVLQSKVSDMEDSIKIYKEENANLLDQLQRLAESKHKLQVKVKLLEKDMEQKNLNMNNRGNISGQIFMESTMSNPVRGHAMNEGDGDLIREILFLKEKILVLEKDCSELTDENLDLLIKLKDLKGSSSGAGIFFKFSSNELAGTFYSSSDSEVTQEKLELYDFEEKVRKNIAKDLEDKYHTKIQSLEDSKTKFQVKTDELVRDLMEKMFEIDELKRKLASKAEQIEHLKACQSELQANVSDLQREKNLVEEIVDILVGEIYKCFSNMQSDLFQRSEFSDGVHSNSSDSQFLGKNSSVVCGNHEIKLHLSEQKEQKADSLASISTKEDQLTCLMSTKRGSGKVEMQYIKSFINSLQDEVDKLIKNNNYYIEDLKQNLKEMKIQWLEAQQKCEYMGQVNTELQAASESLVEECSSLRNSNGELKKQKMELLGNYMNYDTKFVESLTRLSACSSRVEILEDELTLLLEDIYVKEKSLNKDLDALLDESRKDEEIYNFGRNWWDYMQGQKVSNVLPEMVCLPTQTFATCDQATITVPDPVQCVSSLQIDKANIEAVCQKLQAELAWTRTELGASQVESEKKVQSLFNELVSTKQKNEFLNLNNGKMMDLLENYNSSEEEFQVFVSGLEVSQRYGYNNNNIFSKIHTLENRLAEALEANNVQNLQLQRLTKDLDFHEGKPRKIMCKGEMVPKERYDSIKSSLEAELNDIRERYLHMSLKCAEVEAQREELVMKLKAVKNGKRWFT